MELQDLKGELETTIKNKDRAEAVFYQLVGQVALLEDLIKREETKLKEKESTEQK